MLLWLVLALMTAGVVGLLLHPLLAPAARAAQVADGASAVYRDQLSEIDAEVGRGLIGEEEAQAARREIARRLIASDIKVSAPAGSSGDAVPPPIHSPTVSARRFAAAVGVLVPFVALAAYLQTGNPGIPAQPIAARRLAPADNAELHRLINAVEARLKDNPTDGRGWDAIAPVYLRLARYAEAAHAYASANRLLGESPQRLAGLAEALVLGGEGRVSTEARDVLSKLVALDPTHLQARFWLAFAREQEGQTDAAAADYAKLLADAPADVSWRPMVEERLRAVKAAPAPSSKSAVRPDADKAVPGPTAADVTAAERLSPGERQAMIDSMVSGLAARLEKDGRDLAGWQRLIRALIVLGRTDEARAALGRARQSLADEPQALAALAELAKSLGLGT